MTQKLVEQQLQSKDEETSNLSQENKNNSKGEFDENCIRLKHVPDSDDTPEGKKEKIYLDAEIISRLKAMTYILSEIRIDIHKMVND